MSTSPSSQSSQSTNQAVLTAHVPTEGLVSPDRVPVRRALISVYDKTGLLPLAHALADAGVEIVSTGSTAATIAAAGLAVTPVEEVTASPRASRAGSRPSTRPSTPASSPTAASPTTSTSWPPWG